ncbi:MAG: 50S ribosomal protein L3 [Desulfobacterales bacterium]|nr:50S ribosomal protein L3 [Desulfobacterales bacterium]
MCRGLLGKKLGMMSLYADDGKVIPVTVIQAGPCYVTQIKTNEVDGYTALQIAFDERKEKHINKPLKGHFKKSSDKCYSFLKEIKVDNPDDFKLGQEITLNIFNVGEFVNVTGVTKGHGFSGGIRRHGFHGGPKTHGSKCVRIPGSIGSSTWPGRVVKGKKLPGHYGVDQQTVQNLRVVAVREQENLLLVKGAVPGTQNGLLVIKKSLKIQKKAKK